MTKKTKQNGSGLSAEEQFEQFTHLSAIVEQSLTASIPTDYDLVSSGSQRLSEFDMGVTRSSWQPEVDARFGNKWVKYFQNHPL